MEPVVTVLEAARILGVHPESVKRWIRYGELHAEKQGILYYLKRRDLDAFRLMRKEHEEVKQRDYRAYWGTPQGAFVDRIGEQFIYPYLSLAAHEEAYRQAGNECHQAVGREVFEREKQFQRGSYP